MKNTTIANVKYHFKHFQHFSKPKLLDRVEIGSRNSTAHMEHPIHLAAIKIQVCLVQMKEVLQN